MGLNNSKRQKIIEVNNLYDKLEDFECCVCFIERKSKLKRILCGHQLCEKCFQTISGLERDKNKCPLCRQELEAIDDKTKKTCYLDDPFQENYDIDKKEVLSQLDLFNVNIDDINLIKKNIGKVAIIGKLETRGSIMVYFIPFLYQKNFEVIQNFGHENKILLYTLIYDLKQSGYDIWYNSIDVYNYINFFLNSIYI
jgi:hypothetical protein